MPEFERTATIDAAPDDLFDYLADVRHLPDYLPRMTDAQHHDGEHVEVEADLDGDRRHAEAWFRVDDLDQRIEWGSEDGPYHGWLRVDADEPAGSVVTIHLYHEHADAGAETEDDLEDALDNIRRLVTIGQAP
jgi:ribosome-associated toxin RatA of RatAB toxin-antitoxin module